jgi:Ca2+-binding RTX toxin-like protein
VHVYTAFETDAAGNVGPVTAGTAQLGTTGADTLTSTAGNDFFRGAAGADTFSFAAGFGNDVIADFATGGAAHDIINFHAIATLNSFTAVMSHATQIGTGVVIAQDTNDTLTLNNVTKASLTTADFKFV